MPTSEQDLEELHKQNEAIREQIAVAQSLQAQVQNQAELDTRAAQLKAEQAELQQKLESTLDAGEAALIVAEEIAVAAEAPVETAYAKMVREAEEANAAAQAEADAKADAGKKSKPNGNGNTPPPPPGDGNTNGNGGQ